MQLLQNRLNVFKQLISYKETVTFRKCKLYSTDFYCGGQIWRFARGTDCIFKRIQWIPSAQCLQNKQWRSFCFENTSRTFSIYQKVVFTWHYNFVFGLYQCVFSTVTCFLSFISMKLANGPENIEAAIIIKNNKKTLLWMKTKLNYSTL